MGIMNICHIVSGDLWGGAEAQSFQFIIDLCKMSGLSISVIVFNEGILSRKLIAYGINVCIVDESSNCVVVMIKKITSELRRKQVDIVHFHGFKENFLGGIAARLLGLKGLVRTHHGRGVLNSKSINKYIEKINSFFFADKIIAVSSELGGFLCSSVLHENQNKICVVRNGINLTSLDVTKSVVDVRDELNIPADVVVIGTTGRLVREKGHEYLIHATKKIIEKGHNVILVILGNGYLLENDMIIVRELDLSNYVLFPGFVNNVIDYVNIFDLFVMTSISEGIPIALLEAMGLGKPVVVTAVGGIPEVINDKVNCVLIPPANSDVCADVCCELIENSYFRHKLAEYAREHIKKNFLSVHSAQKTKKIYESL